MLSARPCPQHWLAHCPGIYKGKGTHTHTSSCTFFKFYISIKILIDKSLVTKVSKIWHSYCLWIQTLFQKSLCCCWLEESHMPMMQPTQCDTKHHCRRDSLIDLNNFTLGSSIPHKHGIVSVLLISVGSSTEGWTAIWVIGNLPNKASLNWSGIFFNTWQRNCFSSIKSPPKQVSELLSTGFMASLMNHIEYKQRQSG